MVHDPRQKDRKYLTVQHHMKCKLCGSDTNNFLYRVPDLWFQRSDVFAIYRQCSECGLVFKDTELSKTDAQISFPIGIREKGKSSLGFWIGLEARRKIVTRFKKSGKILDIGCGTGVFLYHLSRKNNSWEVIGVEPDKLSAEYGKQKYGINIIPEKFEDVLFSGEKFDVITLWDVIEHVEEPEKVLLKSNELLKEDGILVLRTPNLDSVDSKIFKDAWAGFDSPRHLYVFKKSHINLLLNKADFEVLLMTSHIGGYQNFVKSIRFLLNKRNVKPYQKFIVLGILNLLPIKVIGYIAYNLFTRNINGSELTICAKKRENVSNN